jgi:hypothetical protein
MRPIERRRVDGVFQRAGRPFILELDEIQHFNMFRATTLRCYPDDVPLAFDEELTAIRALWLCGFYPRSTAETKFEQEGVVVAQGSPSSSTISSNSSSESARPSSIARCLTLSRTITTSACGA